MKKIFVLFLMCYISNSIFAAPTSTLSSVGGVSFPAGTLCAPSTDDSIYTFQISQSGGNTTLNTVNFTTTGTYVAGDITNYKLWVNTTRNFATATNIGPTLASAGPGAHSFTAIARALNVIGFGSTVYYFWITTTLPATAVAGHTLTVSAMTAANITITVGTVSSITGVPAGGTQTISTPPTAVSATATPATLCSGDNLTLNGAATNATSYAWAGPAGSGYTSILLNPTIFAVSAIDAGIFTLTATNSCGSTTATTASVVINPLPSAITGTTTLCPLGTTTLSDASGVGTWTSSDNTIATVDASGDVFGVAAGTVSINFALPTGCQVSASVTVSSGPTPITGSGLACQYLTTTLSDAVSGGSWSLSNNTLATMDATTGVVSGLVAGLDTVTYTAVGCSATLEITISPVPAPGAIVGSYLICEGTNTLLTDTPSGGSWVSGNPTIATVDASGNVYGITSGMVGITYNLTNLCGTTGATFVMNIQRPASPIVGLTTVCVGNNITLSDSSAGGIWSAFNDNASISGVGILTGFAVGMDTIVYTVTNSCGTSKVNTIITIGTPADTGTISGSPVVCLGSTILLHESATGGIWSATNGTATVNSSTGLVTSVTSGIDTIIYTVTAACGSSTTNFVVAVDSVVAPQLTISSNYGHSSCSDVPVTFTANSLFGGVSPIFKWKINGFLVDSTDSVYTYIPNNGDVIICQLNTSYPCAIGTSTNDTFIMNVIPTVIPAVNISAGILGDTICAGQVATFTASETNGGTAPIYQWSVNSINTITGNTFAYTPANGDTVACTLVSNHVCAIPDTVKSYQIITVNTTETPLVSITIAPSDTVCSGTIVTCTAHGIYGGTAPSYLWIKNGINVATGVSYSYFPIDLDTIRCEFYSNSPCAVTTSAISSNKRMQIMPVNSPIISLISSQGTTVPFGGSDTLTALVAGAGASPTYQWILNGNPIIGATNNVFILNNIVHEDSINCLVTGTLLGNCPGAENTKTIVINNTNTGIHDLQNAINELILAPNPNNGSFVLNGKLSLDATFQINITNMVGELIYSDKINTNNGTLQFPIQLSALVANGIYLLHISAENENKVIKFAVER